MPTCTFASGRLIASPCLQDMAPHELVRRVRTAHSVAYFPLDGPMPSALAVLSRLEEPAYMDALVHPDTKLAADSVVQLHKPAGLQIICPGLKFRLPRLRLEFEVRKGKVHSLDFGGYWLPAKSDLKASKHKDTLSCVPPFLHSFLLLLPDSEATRAMVLIPDGAIAYNSAAGRITISAVGATPASELRYHAYSVHPHTHHLHAQTKEARLFLAALYAVGGCAAPVPRLGKTGGQMALRLLRQCSGNAPLSSDEMRNLRAIADSSGHTPALRVLAASTAADAAACDFLWPRVASSGAHVPWRAGSEAYMLSEAQNAPAGLPLPHGNVHERLTPYEAAVCLGQGRYFQHGTQRKLEATLPLSDGTRTLANSASALAALQAQLRSIADVANGTRPPSAASSSAPSGPRTPEPCDPAQFGNSISAWFQGGSAAPAPAPAATSLANGCAAGTKASGSTVPSVTTDGMDECLAMMGGLSLDGSEASANRAAAKRRRVDTNGASRNGAADGIAAANRAEVDVPFQTEAIVQQKVGADLISDLRASMQAYLDSEESTAAPEPPTTSLEAAAQMLAELQRKVQLAANGVLWHILRALESFPNTGDGAAFAALRTAGLAASPAQADVVELAYRPHMVQV